MREVDGGEEARRRWAGQRWVVQAKREHGGRNRESRAAVPQNQAPNFDPAPAPTTRPTDSRALCGPGAANTRGPNEVPQAYVSYYNSRLPCCVQLPAGAAVSCTSRPARRHTVPTAAIPGRGGRPPNPGRSPPGLGAGGLGAPPPACRPAGGAVPTRHHRGASTQQHEHIAAAAIREYDAWGPAALPMTCSYSCYTASSRPWARLLRLPAAASANCWLRFALLCHCTTRPAAPA